MILKQRTMKPRLYPKRLICEGTPEGDRLNQLALNTIGEARWNLMKTGDGNMFMYSVPDHHIPIIELLADYLETYDPNEVVPVVVAVAAAVIDPSGNVAP